MMMAVFGRNLSDRAEAALPSNDRAKAAQPSAAKLGAAKTGVVNVPRANMGLMSMAVFGQHPGDRTKTAQSSSGRAKAT